MADGVVPTETDVEVARIGVMMQVEEHGLLDLFERDEKFRQFVENRIAVAAHDTAYINMLGEALNK